MIFKNSSYKIAADFKLKFTQLKLKKLSYQKKKA